MAPADDLFNRFLIPLEQDFDLTGGEVSDPAGHAALDGLLLRIHAEANTLHAAGNLQMCPDIFHVEEFVSVACNLQLNKLRSTDAGIMS